MLRAFRQALARRVRILSILADHPKRGYGEGYGPPQQLETPYVEMAGRYPCVSAKYCRESLRALRQAAKFAILFAQHLLQIALIARLVVSRWNNCSLLAVLRRQERTVPPAQSGNSVVVQFEHHQAKP
jgi:hypothetical protein